MLRLDTCPRVACSCCVLVGWTYASRSLEFVPLTPPQSSLFLLLSSRRSLSKHVCVGAQVHWVLFFITAG